MEKDNNNTDLNRLLTTSTSTWTGSRNLSKESGPDDQIVLASRVRLARNLSEQPFPSHLSPELGQKVVADLFLALRELEMENKGKYILLKMEDLTPLQRSLLVEKHLISRELTQALENQAAAIREDEAVALMINEEDHLRIQCLLPGFQPEEAWRIASEIDDLLEEKLDYAFDPELGYLTACPSNAGTGLRASVLLHLPGIILTKQQDMLLTQLNKVGMTARGFYGEGTKALGHIFQVSNQVTLGLSEDNILQGLKSVVSRLLEHERQARNRLLQEKGAVIEDQVWRSYGIMSQARLLPGKEFMERLSYLRLGLDLGIIQGIDRSLLNRLLIEAQPAFLQQAKGQELDQLGRDRERAKLANIRIGGVGSRE